MKALLKPFIFALATLTVVVSSYLGVTQILQLRSDMSVLETQKMDYEQSISALKNEVESLKLKLMNNKPASTTKKTSQ